MILFRAKVFDENRGKRIIVHVTDKTEEPCEKGVMYLDSSNEMALRIQKTHDEGRNGFVYDNIKYHLLEFEDIRENTEISAKHDATKNNGALKKTEICNNFFREKTLRILYIRNILLTKVDKVDAQQIERFIRQGAKVNIANKYGMTPLILAVKTHAHIDVIQILLKYGANVAVKDKNGKTPLDYAKEYQALEKRGAEVYYLLLEKTLSTNLQSTYGGKIRPEDLDPKNEIRDYSFRKKRAPCSGPVVYY